MTSIFFIAALLGATPASAPAAQTVSLASLGAVKVGAPAPWFAGEDLKDAGSIINLSKVLASDSERTAIVFLASWCTACQRGVSEIIERQHDLAAAKLAVLFVDCQEPREVVQSYVAARKLNAFSVMLDKFGLAAKAYGVSAAELSVSLPKTFVVDKHGRVLAIFSVEGTDYVEQLLSAH